MCIIIFSLSRLFSSPLFDLVIIYLWWKEEEEEELEALKIIIANGY
jgi:hypothetical protein